MRIKTTITLIIILSVMWIGCQKSYHKEVPQYTIEQFMNTSSIFGSSFSYDEQNILFTSDFSGIYNAYMIPVGGGEMVQITNSDSNSVFAISFLPDDNRIIYMSDKNGDEIYHIYLYDKNETVRDLTPFEGARATFSGWRYDQKSYFFSSNMRDKRLTDY